MVSIHVGMNSRIRRVVASLPVIVAAALGLRIAFALDFIRKNPAHALAVVPFLFEPGNIAHSLATGHGFASPFRIDTGPTAWMAPVYPMLLAAIFRVFGVYTYASFLAAVTLNIAFSTLTCIPIFYAGKRIAGPGVAALAAWVWALFPNAVVLPFESLWDACLATLLAATILWATIAIERSTRMRDWVVHGALWGLELMTFPTLLAIFPFLFGWLAWRGQRLRCLTAIAVALLCCAPWMTRNYARFHTFIPFRSNAGLQLWLGTLDVPWPSGAHPINDTAERARYIQLGEIRYMDEKEREALALMREHPGTEARLMAQRFVALWSAGSSHPWADFVRVRSLRSRWALLWNIGTAIAAAIALLVLFRARNPYAIPIAVFPIIVPWAYYLTLANARYRLPVDPAVMLLTAIALQQAFARFRTYRLRKQAYQDGSASRAQIAKPSRSHSAGSPESR